MVERRFKVITNYGCRIVCNEGAADEWIAAGATQTEAEEAYRDAIEHGMKVPRTRTILHMKKSAD